MSRRRSGFTMVEILVAIVIIAILIGLVTVGFRRVSLGGLERSTRTTLENCRAMIAEYERKNKISGFSGALPAPGDVTAEGGGVARNGPQVIFTRTVFGLLLGVPENKAAFGQIPPDQLYPNPDPSPTPPAAPAWTNATNYTAFVSRVTFPASPLTGPKYICTGTHTSSATNSPDQPGSPWIAETAAARSTTILLDAWNNPILFVPAGGLTGVSVKGATTPLTVKTNDANPRPFFASAGPDGDFAQGDDNLYSFEN